MLRFGFVVLLCVLCNPVGAWCGMISPAEIQEALATYIRKNAPAGAEMVEWHLTRGESLPAQGRIVGVEKGQGADWQERTALRVRVERESESEETIRVSVRMKFTQGVVVACRSLPIGHLVAPEDVRRESRDGLKNLKEAYPGIDEIVGRRIWRPISGGAPIKRWHIREDAHLKSGDTVVIVTHSGRVRVEAPGKILEPAKPGDRVRVVNVLSGKEILATVLDSATVSVTF
jgi:flagella basal body P-ring formation protein FlgA